MRGWITRLAAAAALAALPFALAACVQVRLDTPPAWLSPPPAPKPAAKASGAIYLVHGERLARVGRPLGKGASPLSSLSSLLDGPTAAERKAGITTAIPAGRDNGSSLDFSGYVHADFPAEFARGSDALVRLRMAQVVYTLTETGKVKGVLFEIEGKRAQHLGGISAIRPVVRRDLGALAP